jgi:hypothetical protein
MTPQVRGGGVIDRMTKIHRIARIIHAFQFVAESPRFAHVDRYTLSFGGTKRTPWNTATCRMGLRLHESDGIGRIL